MSQTIRATPRRRRRAVTIAAVALVLGLVGTAAVWSLTEPARSSASAVVLPETGASAIRVTGADDILGPTASTMLAGHDPDTRYPLASMSKLITALVILDNYPLTGDEESPWLTYSADDSTRSEDYGSIGASVEPMPGGSQQSEREAIASMLVPSASNYASVLASWFFGTDERFQAATRTWLDENGLHDTNVVEPTGISQDNHSTARDMLTIGSLAAADPVLAEITSRPTTTLADGSTVNNTNTLLGVDGITGLKTGNLGPGTFALVYSATIDAGGAEPVRVIGVQFGGESRESVAADVRATLASVRTLIAAR